MYYYRDGIHSVGPFTEQKLVELHSKGIISDQTLVRTAESDAWFEYSKISLVPEHAAEPVRRAEPHLSEVTNARIYAEPADHGERATESITQVDSAWVLAPVAPWRRYFARMFDLTIFGALAWFLVGYAWYSLAPLQADKFFNQMNPTVDAILSILLGSLVSGLILGFVGTTPGKSIFGIRVKTLKGRSIGIGNGLARDLTVFAKGLGLGIPFISLVTLILSYRELKKHQVTTWDAGKFTVTYRRNTGAQIAMTIAGLLLYAVILALLLAIAQTP